MHDHFRHAGGAGREHDPFGVARRLGQSRVGCDLRRGGDAQSNAERRAGREVAIQHDGVDFGAGNDRGEMNGIGVGRQDDEPANHAVKLDQSQRGGQLAGGGDKNRFARQLVEPAAEAGAAGKLRHARARVAIEQEAFRRTERDALPQRRRLNARHVRRLSRNRRKSGETSRRRTP